MAGETRSRCSQTAPARPRREQLESVWRKKKRKRRSKRGSISLTADHLPVVTGLAVKGTSVVAVSSGVSPVVFAEALIQGSS